MTSVTGIPDRATERLPHPIPSSNGGPPPRSARGPAPLAVVAAAFLLGVALAKFLDWRTHAHPRD